MRETSLVRVSVVIRKVPVRLYRALGMLDHSTELWEDMIISSTRM